jgi:hypothetical protein
LATAFDAAISAADRTAALNGEANS